MSKSELLKRLEALRGEPIQEFVRKEDEWNDYTEYVDAEKICKKPVVSCCVFTYNQEKYIRECLDSIVSQAAGCPVISTDCLFGLREILHDGEYGILCENKNPVGLADAICRVVNGGGINSPMQSWMPYMVESIVEMYETNLKT